MRMQLPNVIANYNPLAHIDPHNMAPEITQ